jgi:hypothetical protein
MLYILGTKVNTYYLIKFDHQSSGDFLLFQEGRLLYGGIQLNYQIENGKNLSKIKRTPYIQSTGPSLVSLALKDLLKEEEEKGEVEFFDVNIFCDGKSIDGFFAINPTNRIDCTDMERSEYSIANFDPQNPSYAFDYHVLKQNFGCNLNIAICNEMPRMIIINDTIVDRIRASKIKGFILHSSLDMTMNDRSICIES